MPIEFRTGSPEARAAWRSLVRGFIGRCPNCGEGRLFRGYLKAVDACPVCGEVLHHQRSDDFGPYVTMTVVGHVVVPLLLAVMLATVISPLAVLAVALPLTAILGLVLLRPIKGAIIGLQWALRMHGFGEDADPDRPRAVLPRPDTRAGQPCPKTGLGTK